MTLQDSPTSMTDETDIHQLKHLVEELRTELSRQKQTEDNLRRAVTSAETAQKAQRDALAHVSHEMRTQLQIIDGTVELLQDAALTPEQQECIDRCRSANGLLLTLVDDILDGARMEAGHFSLEYEAFSPAELVIGTGKLLTLMARRKGLSLDCQAEPEIPDRLMGDPRRIRQILVNLAGNAIKFTHQGSISVRAEVAGNIPPGTMVIRFSVDDTGIGIPGTRIEAIFEPFVRITRTDHPLSEGAGLGLAITRNLIDLMGGSLEVKSCEGKGSRFSFTLPLPVASPAILAPAPVDPEKLPSSRPGLRILLADDASDVRSLIQAFLISAGYTVETAENGQQAVEKFRDGSFDLVLMDMQMPVMDGYHATRLIREWERSRGKNPVPVVALTACTERGDLSRSRESGCTVHLSKPIRKESLLRAVAAQAKG